MKIYLVRHGESTTGIPDDKRPLSKQGTRDIQQLANFISPLKIHVSRILQSPKYRAEQTATILASSIQARHGIETRNELDPIASIDPILEEIYAKKEDILLVGHMPFMGKLVSQLIASYENKDIVLFQPGSMVCLEHIHDEQWIIHWMLTPFLFNSGE